MFILLIKTVPTPATLLLFDISWWLTYLGPVVNPYLFAFRLQSFRSVIRDWIKSFSSAGEVDGYAISRISLVRLGSNRGSPILCTS